MKFLSFWNKVSPIFTANVMKMSPVRSFVRAGRVSADLLVLNQIDYVNLKA